MRGYCGIGICGAKFDTNVGTLWRSAYCLGASFIFTIGARYRRQPTDTTESFRHIPLLHFADAEDFLAHRPADCALVGVEITERALALETFAHPERAAYILGPEDGNLPEELLAACDYVVRFTSAYCLNVAAAGTVVMYDRAAKTRSARRVDVHLSECQMADGPDVAESVRP